MVEELNSLQPIKPGDTVELKAAYRKYEEKTGQERTDVGRELPEEFNDLGILLSYQNSKKSRFYTIYDYSRVDNKYSFLKKRPKEYKDN